MIHFKSMNDRGRLRASVASPLYTGQLWRYHVELYLKINGTIVLKYELVLKLPDYFSSIPLYLFSGVSYYADKADWSKRMPICHVLCFRPTSAQATERVFERRGLSWGTGGNVELCFINEAPLSSTVWPGRRTASVLRQ